MTPRSSRFFPVLPAPGITRSRRRSWAGVVAVGVHAFLLIGGIEERREALRFDLTRDAERDVGSAMKDALRLRDCERTL